MERVDTHFAVAADEKLALGGVDTVAGERINLDLLHSRNNDVSSPSDTQNVTNAPSIS